MNKHSAILLTTAALLLAGAAALWCFRAAPVAPPVSAHRPPPAAPTIRMVGTSAHRTLSAKDPAGTARLAPPLPSLADALDHDANLSASLRLEVVNRLDDATASRETARLAAFVANPRLPAGLATAEHRALKNDVLNVLARVESFRPELIALLKRIQADPTQDSAMRDYALQHLSGLEAPTPDATALHWQAAEGADPALAATAMLHLLSLDRYPSQVSGFNSQVSGSPPVSSLSPQVSNSPLSPSSRTRLGIAALRLASDATAPEPSRATALQVCARLKLTEARSLAYALADNVEAGVPLRVAAIATLGDLGEEPATRDLLTRLTVDRETRLRLPARSSLGRL